MLASQSAIGPRVDQQAPSMYVKAELEDQAVVRELPAQVGT